MKKCNTEVGKKRKIENKIEQKTNNMLKHQNVKTKNDKNFVSNYIYLW